MTGTTVRTLLIASDG